MAIEKPTDAELATLARAGDRRSFEQLVERYKQPLYRFARRYVGNDDDAYDVVQDSFVSAWLAFKRFDSERSVGAWLRAIAINKCRDLGRRKSVRRRMKAMLEVFERIRQDEAERISAAPPEHDRLSELDAAIAELPPFYKEPLLLSTVGGLSQEQTAKELGTTTKAVEMRVRRAKQQLAATLTGKGREG